MGDVAWFLTPWAAEDPQQELRPPVWPCQVVSPSQGRWSGLWKVRMLELTGCDELLEASREEMFDFACGFARFFNACSSTLFRRAVDSAICKHVYVWSRSQDASPGPSGSPIYCQGDGESATILRCAHIVDASSRLMPVSYTHLTLPTICSV